MRSPPLPVVRHGLFTAGVGTTSSGFGRDASVSRTVGTPPTGRHAPNKLCGANSGLTDRNLNADQCPAPSHVRASAGRRTVHPSRASRHAAADTDAKPATEACWPGQSQNTFWHAPQLASRDRNGAFYAVNFTVVLLAGLR